MKNFKKNTILALVVCLIITINVNGQKIASSDASDMVAESEVANQNVSDFLGDKTFTYKYQGEKVLVVFNKNEQTEYFNNKKHFIKSTVSCKSNNECTMTLKESNLPRFPFKSGTKMKMKITKVKKGYIYYESTLGGRTWSGKMKQS